MHIRTQSSFVKSVVPTICIKLKLHIVFCSLLLHFLLTLHILYKYAVAKRP